NIRDLRTAGFGIIFHQVFFFVETALQDGQTRAVVSAANRGVVTHGGKDAAVGGRLYFSSARNRGAIDSTTSCGPSRRFRWRGFRGSLAGREGPQFWFYPVRHNPDTGGISDCRTVVGRSARCFRERL